MRLRTGLGVAALLLLVGGTACGDDDATPGANPGTDAGDAGNGGESAGSGDPCSLLEVAEIEAAFGDYGAVADGKPLGISCAWDVGDISDPGTGTIAVTRARGAGTPEQSMAEIRDLTTNPVEIDGVGDEAFFDGSSLWFRAGDITLSVTAAFLDDVPGAQDKLTSLAQLMVDRA